MKSLPKYVGDMIEFEAELNRRRDKHKLSDSGMDGRIKNISFICACHGTIDASLVDSGLPIRAGKYKEKIKPESTENVPIYNNNVSYVGKVPIIDFQFSKIDARKMNITLSTTKTCFGATVGRPNNSAFIKQKFVNDIMENIPSVCPTNTLTERGKYGETFVISHEEYELERQQSASRKIQRFMRKISKSPRSKSPRGHKTRLMTYEKEKVDWLLNKKYSVKTCDVATIDPLTHEAVYEVDIIPTACDAHKLIMIVSRYTTEGCETKKYILLASDLEIDDEKDKIYDDFSRAIGNFYTDVIEEHPADLIMGKKHGYPSFKISLHNLVMLGKKIIEETNGIGESATVPIDIYDLSCNSFGIFQNKKQLNERERHILRIIDDYARRKNIAYGQRKKKTRRRVSK